MTTSISCIEDAEIELDVKPRLFLNCILTPDDYQTATLGLVGSIYSQKNGTNYGFESIKEADLRLYANDKYVGNFELRNQTWYLQYNPISGVRYTIVAEVPGFDTIKAETIMPTSIPIELTPNWHLLTKPTKGAYSLTQYSGKSAYWICLIKNIGFQDYIMLDIGTNHPFVDKFNETTHIVNFEEEDAIGRGSYLAHKYYLRINEYDKYLKSAWTKAHIYLEYPMPIAGYETDSVYSNIEGGYGIFGGVIQNIVNLNTFG